jgi:hypothetical protein
MDCCVESAFEIKCIYTLLSFRAAELSQLDILSLEGHQFFFRG